MPLQVNIFLLLFGGLQGILLVLFLLKKKIYRSNFAWLFVYIVVMLLQVALKVISKVWLMENHATIYFLSYQFPFLYGPLLYMFIRQMTDGKRQFKTKDLMHFAPFVCVLLYLAFANQNTEPWPGFNVFLHPVSRLVLQLTSVMVYHGLALIKLSRAFNAERQEPYIPEKQLKWLRRLAFASFIVSTLVSVVIYLMYIYFPAWNNIRFGFVLLTIFIYWISYCALNKPTVFSVIPGNKPSVWFNKDTPRLRIVQPGKKYANSGLKPGDLRKAGKRLQQLMVTHKPFLDSELNIEKLASMLSCSKHHLSQVLNDYFQQSFYGFINNARVEEVKRLLADPQNENYTIASIAYDAGFNSISTFNDVFKKFTGKTPSCYKEENKHRQSINGIVPELSVR